MTPWGGSLPMTSGRLACGSQWRRSRPARTSGPGTGRCLIMVTPDAEKTMCTNLGIGARLGPDDVDVEAIRAARAIYLEGYLTAPGATDAAVERAVSVAREPGVLVALSLSDPAWVGLHRRALDAHPRPGGHPVRQRAGSVWPERVRRCRGGR